MMTMLERAITDTINAGVMGMIPATVGAVEQETRYEQALDRQEEAFRKEKSRAARHRMIRISCE